MKMARARLLALAPLPKSKDNCRCQRVCCTKAAAPEARLAQDSQRGPGKIGTVAWSSRWTGLAMGSQGEGTARSPFKPNFSIFFFVRTAQKQRKDIFKSYFRVVNFTKLRCRKDNKAF
jgi:hypothetical protein